MGITWSYSSTHVPDGIISWLNALAVECIPARCKVKILVKARHPLGENVYSVSALLCIVSFACQVCLCFSVSYWQSSAMLMYDKSKAALRLALAASATQH